MMDRWTRIHFCGTLGWYGQGPVHQTLHRIQTLQQAVSMLEITDVVSRRREASLMGELVIVLWAPRSTHVTFEADGGLPGKRLSI